MLYTSIVYLILNKINKTEIETIISQIKYILNQLRNISFVKAILAYNFVLFEDTEDNFILQHG